MANRTLGRDTGGFRKEMTISEILANSGAAAWRAVATGEVSAEARRHYLHWISEGNHARMDYLTRYPEVRFDTRLLLEDAKSMICCAFPFKPTRTLPSTLPYIASYALGEDYHDVIRRRLKKAAQSLKTLFEGNYRVCVDTAPVMERYWAAKARLGSIGRNGALIVPGVGSMVFLAEIVSTVDFCNILSDDTSGIESLCPESSCNGCGQCIKSCPGGALSGGREIDCRRCISYLSIEHRGEWDEEGRAVMQSPQGRRTLYGCDLCLTSCPLNASAPATGIEEFALRPEYLSLHPQAIASISEEEFSSLFSKSAIRRARLEGLHRNLHNLTSLELKESFQQLDSNAPFTH